MMEQSIKTKLNAASANTFPNKAQEGTSSPYVVYRRTNTDRNPTLTDQGTYRAIFEFNIIGSRYSNMLTLKSTVKATFEDVIGQYRAGGPYIQATDIINEMDMYYEETGYHEGILEIEFTYNL